MTNEAKASNRRTQKGFSQLYSTERVQPGNTERVKCRKGGMGEKLGRGACLLAAEQTIKKRVILVSA